MENKEIPAIDVREPAEDKNRFHYIDAILTLLAVTVMSFYLYGIRVLWLLLAALAAALAAEFICDRMAGKKRIPKRDYSWVVTALITVMLMPATAPVWMAVFSVLFGLCVAKHPFGGTGKNIFNPAAAGIAFCAICWPDKMLSYPVPLSLQGVTDPALISYGISPASVLRVGGTPKIDYFDILLGKFAGPLGATCMIVLGACLLYLLLRRKVSSFIVFPAFAVVFFLCGFFPRVVTGESASVIYEFSSGALVFGVIFMANDPATMPDTRGGRLFYGILIGLITVLMRRFGAIELEFAFVILLANVFAGSCDSYAAFLGTKWNGFLQRSRKKHRAAAGKKKAGVLNA